MELVKYDGEMIILAEAAIQKMAEVSRMKAEVDAYESKLKDELLKAMEEHGVKKFENDLISAVYVAPTVRRTVDSKALKALYPEIAQSLEKESPVKSSVRVTFK
jgi:hypothetical protein